MLRQIADRAGALGIVERDEIAIADAYCSRAGLVDAGQHLEERRLARPVGADDGDRSGRSERKRQVVEQRRTVAFDHKARGGNAGHVRNRRASRRMKNGPPATAVTRPSGISAGGRAERAMASARVTTIAPT